jgi:hypothetical protein
MGGLMSHLLASKQADQGMNTQAPSSWLRATLSGWGRAVLLIFVAAILVGYWFLPIPGQILYDPAHLTKGNAWPQVRLEPPAPAPGTQATVAVTDTTPWINIELTVAGHRATFERYEINGAAGYWTWYHAFTVPSRSSYELVFFHDCDTGCLERARLTIGATTPAAARPADNIATKLGVVFANPERDWHNRSAWDVELTYARQFDREYWSVDDLAERVQRAAARGLRVLVRVDYDQGQSIPPANDNLALDSYLRSLRRLARDERLKPVYGYVIGSSYNTRGNNLQAPAALVTPAWYARVFNGYGVDPLHGDNVVETIRAENPAVRVLVGPVAPWSADQDGRLPYAINVPWLNYMNSLVSALDASTSANEAVGVPLVAPDGFAVQAPGRPDRLAPGSASQADEPRTDLPRAGWNGAQAGFRVYRDWLGIINSYAHTHGLPVYITSANTFQYDTGTPPAQNYPRGWLASALDVVNREPQIRALCWFIDAFPMDNKWDLFSLTNPHGLLVDAADDFDRLLNQTP